MSPHPRSRLHRLACAAVLGLGLVSGTVLAADAEDDDDSAADTVTGRPIADRSSKSGNASSKAKPIPTVDAQSVAALAKDLARHEGKPLPAITYLASEWLSIPPEFVQECRQGLDLIFLRDYKGAKKKFNEMAVVNRGWGVGTVGQVLVWQALMLENFDFKYDSQYKVANRAARMELEEALQIPGNEAWENFLLAGILGIESIHLMRKEDFAKALHRGYEAMKAVKKTQELAPEFTDINLGDGLFNYWVSVVSQHTKLIPDMTDKREIGIQQLLLVERSAVFLRPPATLALTFTWIEEGKKREALKSGLRNHRKYPDNIINNQVLGRVYMYNRMYEDSERIFQHVLTVDPKNQRAHYYIARLYLRWGKLKKADRHLATYLAFTDIDNKQRADALYYQGTLRMRQKNPKAAEKLWKEAVRIAKHKRAKRRLEKMKNNKKKK
ncbi:MAG: tetratricopeptide repeat protein [Myxococcota bacterium]|nr:tetratricopeptide repeat protein [Myxococcota bacterium]